MWVSCVWVSCVCGVSCVWVSCVWVSCVWVSCVCVCKLCVGKLCMEGWRRKEGGGRKCTTKNKYPTQWCGEKTECRKHEGFRPLFDAQMSKKCALLWHEAHLSKEVWKPNFRQYAGMEKQRWEESGRRRKVRRAEKRKSGKQEDAGAQKGRKVAIHCVFPMIWGSGGSKSNLAKAAGAEPAGQMSAEKLHAVVARSTFPSQNVQSTPGSDHFWCWDVEKVHAVVARSTFPSQKCKKLRVLRCF